MPDAVTVPVVPPLATIPNVELIHTGTWDVGGKLPDNAGWTVTTDDLYQATAALDCPAVRRPILKLGHYDPRFNPPPLIDATGEPIMYDGQPAVGWIDNLGVVQAGRTLVGDYVGMPGWLGAILASAYPDRSIEGEYNHVCQIGHTHPFVLTAVALLGVTAPGIGTLQSLQDVATLYGVAATSAVPGGGTRVTVTINAGSAREVPTMPNPSPMTVAAGVTTEDVRRKYYGSGVPWDQWIESIQLEPLELVVCNDASGKRYRIPVAIGDGDGEDAVTFGEPTEVVIRYEDVTAASVSSSPSAGRRRLTYASRAESRPGQAPQQPARPAPQNQPAPAGGTPAATPAAHENRSPDVEFSTADLAALRVRAGIPEGEELTAAHIMQLLAAGSPAPPAQQPEATPAQQQPAQPAAVTGVMSIDVAAWQGTQTRMRELEEDKKRRDKAERDEIVQNAVMAGKFPAARREHWRALWDKDPDGTRNTIAALAPGVVPVTELGIGDDSHISGSGMGEFAHLFPPDGTEG